MRVTELCVWCAGVLYAVTGCTLLLDRDALTNGSGMAGAGGQVGAAGSGGNSGGGDPNQCTPGPVDLDCDGLDAACAPALGEATCPAGCTGAVRNSVSYMACTESSTFDEAEVRCQRQRMHLVKIDGSAENNFVVQLAQTLGSYVWIGGSNREVDDAFAWTDGAVFYQAFAPVPGVYQNFDSGQPVSDAARGCLQIHSASPGTWSNTRCSDTLQFVCERY